VALVRTAVDPQLTTLDVQDRAEARDALIEIVRTCVPYLGERAIC